MLLGIRRFLRELSRPDRGVLFGLNGFAVRIHPFFWLTCVPLTFHASATLTAWLLAVVVVTSAVLAHEMGHAVVASRWAVVHGITLHGLGGETRWFPVLAPPTWRQRVVILLSGPAAGLLVATLAAAALRWTTMPPLAELAAWQLLWTNVAWSVFNLLPIPPMDGGQVTYEFLYRRIGARADLWSPALATAVLAVALLYSLWAGSAVTIGLLLYFGVLNGLKLKAWYDANRTTQWDRLPTAERERS